MTEERQASIGASGWSALAHEFVPRFAERAAALDESDTFASENYVELRHHRVFSAGIPEALGGGGASLAEIADFLRILARGCGSTALALSMHTHVTMAMVWRWHHHGAPVDALLRRIAMEQLVVVSTGGNDGLNSLGDAAAVAGGFRVNACKRFASGVVDGDMISTSAVFDDPTAGSTVLHFFLPRDVEGVRVDDNWRVLGMRATGSNDLIYDNVFVPDTSVGVRRARGLSFHLASTIRQSATVQQIARGIPGTVRLRNQSRYCPLASGGGAAYAEMLTRSTPRSPMWRTVVSRSECAAMITFRRRSGLSRFRRVVRLPHKFLPATAGDNHAPTRTRPMDGASVMTPWPRF